MHRALLIFLILIAATERQAAEPCCVDDLFAEAFLYGRHFSREWPDSFPVAPLSEPSLQMIGSQVSSQTHGTAIAWRSNDDLAGSFAAVKRALSAQDWREVPMPGMVMQAQGRGFILASAAPEPTFEMPRRFCKGVELIHAIQRTSPRGTIVTLSASPSGGADCDMLIAQTAAQSGQRLAMNSFMRAASALPVLRLPESIEKMSMADSSGGSSAAVRAVIVPALDTSTSEVIHHFDSQMNEQGWFSESAFGAGDFVGSVWRTAGERGSFVAWLMAYDRGEDLLIRMTVLDPEAQGAASMNAVSVFR